MYDQYSQFMRESLNCSAGTENIFKALFNMSNMRNANLIFDTLIINALTITRNCLTKDHLVIDDVKGKIVNDVNQLLMYFSQYISSPNIAPYIDTPYIIIYNPTYRIAAINARKLTDTNRRIMEFTNNIFKSICTNPPYIHEMDNCKLYGITAGTRDYVHKDIIKFIQETCNIHARKLSTRRYLLVSHCAMDFHIADSFKDRLILLESYTGALKHPNEFGKKVFKEPGIPFNKYTHTLLGDDTHVKQLAYRADKKKIYAIAKQNRWDIKPLASIRTDIKNSGIIPIELVTTFNF